MRLLARLHGTLSGRRLRLSGRAGVECTMDIALNCNPYSRAQWTELQLRFRPPRDGPTVSTCLRDYATAEEIGVVVAALQLLWRELSVRARQSNNHKPHVRRGAGCCPGRHVGCL